MTWDGKERRAMNAEDRDRITRVEEGLRQHREQSHEWRKEVRTQLEAIAQKLDGVPDAPPRHKEDHDFITAFIEREKRRTERHEKIKAQVGGWAIIALLSGVAAAVWRWALHAFGRG